MTDFSRQTLVPSQFSPRMCNLLGEGVVRRESSDYLEVSSNKNRGIHIADLMDLFPYLDFIPGDPRPGGGCYWMIKADSGYFKKDIFGDIKYHG